jgi:CHAT domain-containing protein
MQAVAARFQSTTALTGADASVAALREKGANFDVIHIASRGTWWDRGPLFPGIRMADGWLSEVDAYRLELNASLVALSGRPTHETRTHRFDANNGLVRGLMYAGTPAVLTSLWTMDEEPATEFMSRFYGALRGGASRSAAVRKAQLEAKSTSRHPYHWAPFVMNGAW